MSGQEHLRPGRSERSPNTAASKGAEQLPKPAKKSTAENLKHILDRLETVQERRRHELTGLQAAQDNLGIPRTTSSVAIAEFDRALEELKIKSLFLENSLARGSRADAQEVVGEMSQIVSTPEFQTAIGKHNAASEYYESIKEFFRKLPESSEKSRFFDGEIVLYPAEDKDKTPVRWEIVHVEKGHFLLERASNREGHEHVVCSEADLLEYNNRET